MRRPASSSTAAPTKPSPRPLTLQPHSRYLVDNEWETNRPWRHGAPALNEGTSHHGKGREEQDVLISSSWAWAGGKGSRRTGMGRAWGHRQVPHFLLIHQMDSQKTGHTLVNSQLRPCLAPISVNSLSSNRKNRRWAGGVLGQRGHRDLARVALVVQPLLA